MKLSNDVDSSSSKRIFDVLREETHLLAGLSVVEVEQASAIFKMLYFKKGEELAVQGGICDFFGFIVSGTAIVMMNNKCVRTLKMGDSFGQLSAADMTRDNYHLSTIIAETDGVIGVLPFNEARFEEKKNPHSVSMFL